MLNINEIPRKSDSKISSTKRAALVITLSAHPLWILKLIMTAIELSCLKMYIRNIPNLIYTDVYKSILAS